MSSISKPSNLGEDYFNNSIREPYLSALIENLKRRFDDKAEIASFSVFNPEKLRKSGTAMEYGVQEIETFAQHYQGLQIIGSIEECIDEWKTYRQFLLDNCSDMRFSEVIQDLCINSTTATIFPNMSTLAKICRVIPIHTADADILPTGLASHHPPPFLRHSRVALSRRFCALIHLFSAV